MTASQDLFAVKANLGVVLRGSLDELTTISNRLEELCSDRGVKIAFKKASASRLWIKEDGDERNRPLQS
ncbi:MAG: hypothetical protein LN413_01080 [Candidatus Thermoplasmatota archaeon]|nr:hypothetical protein [Candidatus Thermoplasmatota archaeon]